MHVLRLLRVLLPVLVVALIIGAVIVVIGARRDLQQSRREVAAAWTPLRGALDGRYTSLEAADTAVRDTPGPVHDLAAQVDDAYASWRNLEQHDASVGSEVAAANTLEGLGRRLVRAVRAAPRLQGDDAALGPINAYADAALPRGVAGFNSIVQRYENDRNQPAHRLAARVFGYDVIPALDATGST